MNNMDRICKCIFRSKDIDKFIEACKHGNIDTVQKKYIKILDIFITHNKNYINIIECEDCNDNIIKCKDRDPCIMNKALNVACNNDNNIDIIKWLYHLSIDKYNFLIHGLDQSCINGNLELAKWFYTQGAEITSHIFYYCHKNLIQWLYQMYKGIIPVDEILMYACLRGEFDIAQWAHQMGANIHYDNDIAFRYAITSNNLHIVKWLHSLGANIAAKNNAAFISACRYGRIDSAKWLYENGIDIHANNDLAFEYACNNNKITIVKWLYQFNVNILCLSKSPSIEILRTVFNLNDIEIDFFRGILKGDLKIIDNTINNGVNYKMLKHYAFFKSCSMNNILIVNYLSELSSRYYYEINNNIIENYEKKKYLKCVR